MIGLHEALERGLVFGRDIGFTYGPLGHMFYPLNEGTAPTISILAITGTEWPVFPGIIAVLNP